mgnify:CR=1 FL=1
MDAADSTRSSTATTWSFCPRALECPACGQFASVTEPDVRTLRGWRGNRSAYILLFGFAAVIFTYYGNYFFGGLHAYGGV